MKEKQEKKDAYMKVLKSHQLKKPDELEAS